jgi:hypothetical protein
MRTAITLLMLSACVAETGLSHAPHEPDKTVLSIVNFGVLEMLKVQGSFIESEGFKHADLNVVNHAVNAYLDSIVRFVDCAQKRVDEHNVEFPDSPWAGVEAARVSIAGKETDSDRAHACEVVKTIQ